MVSPGGVGLAGSLADHTVKVVNVSPLQESQRHSAYPQFGHLGGNIEL